MGGFYRGVAGARGSNPKGVVIHNDAGSRYANCSFYRSWLPHHEAYLGFAHYYVAEDGIYQAEYESNMAWHCANTYGNRELIGIEACQSMGDESVFRRNEQASFKLAAQILKRYGLKANRNTVRLHKELSPTSCPHRSWALHGSLVNAVKDYFISQINKYMGGSASPSKPSNHASKPSTSGKKVTVLNTATRWSPSSGSKPINKLVLGRTYDVHQTRKINYSRSTEEYLLVDKGTYVGWILSQDVKGGPVKAKAKPKSTSSNKAASTSAKEWSENGTFITNAAGIAIRTGHSTSSGLIARLPRGSYVKYDRVWKAPNNYIWIRQRRGNSYGWIATGQTDNKNNRKNYWGSFR